MGAIKPYQNRPTFISARKSLPRLVLRHTKKFGKAVFADQDIQKGSLVEIFDGRIYDGRYDQWNDDLLNHTIQVGPQKWRDSLGLARYLNHSCDPNCGIKGLYRIVAMRNIRRGEQITWDYEMTEMSTWWRMKCLCGSQFCRSKIGHFKFMPLEVRKRYKGFISRWIKIRENQKVFRKNLK